MLENLRKRLNGGGAVQARPLAPIGTQQQYTHLDPNGTAIGPTTFAASTTTASSSASTTASSPQTTPGTPFSTYWNKLKGEGSSPTLASSGASFPGGRAPPPLAPTRRKQTKRPAPTETPPTAPPIMTKASFTEALGGTVNLRVLGGLSEKGVPDELRSLYWKVLLGFMPEDSTEWEQTLAAKRAQYWGFCEELIVVPDKVMEVKKRQETPPVEVPEGGVEGAGAVEETEGKDENDEEEADHPLCSSTSSPWSVFLHNKSLLQTIDVDLPRTMPSLHFFNHDAPDTSLTPTEHNTSPETLSRMNTMEPTQGKPFTKSQQHLRRLLFIFVKLNPGLNYVQGMNEVSGHLFYAFASHLSRPYVPCAVCAAKEAERKEAKGEKEGEEKESKGPSCVSCYARSHCQTMADAEADAFFAFTVLMSHLGGNFCRSLDTDVSGITGSLKGYIEVFKRCDPVLQAHMESKNLKPEFYCFRWVTLLLSQEFMVPDVLRVWDFLFGEVEEINTRLWYVCVSMSMSLRDELLACDFSEGMQKLQDFSHRCVDGFIFEARELMELHRK